MTDNIYYHIQQSRFLFLFNKTQCSQTAHANIQIPTKFILFNSLFCK